MVGVLAVKIFTGVSAETNTEGPQFAYSVVLAEILRCSWCFTTSREKVASLLASGERIY
jgi:hypothetical protein